MVHIARALEGALSGNLAVVVSMLSEMTDETNHGIGGFMFTPSSALEFRALLTMLFDFLHFRGIPFPCLDGLLRCFLGTLLTYFYDSNHLSRSLFLIHGTCTPKAFPLIGATSNMGAIM